LGYAVRIEAFEGPLDLLLYLIRKNEVEIYEIPIAQITQHYLDYIDVMQMLDLEVAGDFLVMAATLMQIKARMLLPSHGVEEEEDPRLDLIRQLEEYQLYKQAAETLADRESTYVHYFLREAGPGPVDLPESEDVLLDVTLFDLLSAFHEALDRVREEGRYEVTGPEIKLTDQVTFLREVLKEQKRVSFMEILVMLTTRMAMVVTLVAILELARTGELKIEQPDMYGDIWLIRGEPGVTFTPVETND
jgi:segregation and condensation protein A